MRGSADNSSDGWMKVRLKRMSGACGFSVAVTSKATTAS
jgi:hypothetical protein